MNSQNLSLYKLFYTVAETGSVSKAAETLFISQPAVSKSLQKLELSLGTPLFLRSSRGVQLTEDGAFLYQHVKTAFQALELGESELEQRRSLGIGRLKIGVSATLCKYVLLPYLKDFISLHPHIQISIECQSTKHTLEMLEAGAIDIGLIGRPESLPNMQFLPVGEIQDTFVAAKAYLEHLSIRTQSTDTLLSKSVLMLLDRENLTRQYVDDYLAKYQLHPGSVLEASTMDLLIEFAKIGLGIACVIREFVEQELTTKELEELPLTFPIPARQTGFVYLKKSLSCRALSEFLQYLDLPTAKS